MPSEDAPLKKRSIRSKRRRMGIPAPGRLVPNDDAKAHVIHLNQTHGMSYRQIARLGKTSESTLSEMVTGRRGKNEPHSGMNRHDLCQRLLAVQPQHYDTDRGARIPACGVHRRLRALQAIGFNYQFMSEYLGYSTRSRSSIGMMFRNTWTHVRVHESVDAMYQKLRYEDPLDWGICANSKSKAINRARRLAFPPPMCWDDETIDDQDAQPEWTGACGSMQGVRLHRKHELPMCDPCKDAQRANLRRLKEDYGNGAKREELG